MPNRFGTIAGQNATVFYAGGPRKRKVRSTWAVTVGGQASNPMDPDVQVESS
jgi:hypothetical protein